MFGSNKGIGGLYYKVRIGSLGYGKEKIIH